MVQSQLGKVSAGHRGARCDELAVQTAKGAGMLYD